jgi:hypothetical protein
MRPLQSLPSAMMLCVALSACGAPSGAKSGGGAPAAGQAAATPASVILTPGGAPTRRDGYWEMGSFSESGSPMSKQFLCVGGGSEAHFSVFDQLAAVGDCSQKTFTRTASGWSFETRCKLMDQVTVQKGTISGDFQTAFRVDQAVSQGPGTEIKGSIRGRRIGDCPAKFAPGDLVDGDGDKLGNMLPH